MRKQKVIKLDFNGFFGQNKQLIEEREKYGLIPTLNKRGYLKEYLCNYSLEFLNFSKNSFYPVLEIGAAYGVASLEALKNGATVITNDLDERHLSIYQDNIPAEYRKRSIIIPGRFPQDLKFHKNSLSAILASRVFNYLTGTEIEIALKHCFDWLVPGGKIFITTESPYKKMFKNFLPLYEQRKKQNIRWAGEIEDITLYTSERLEYLPKFLHLIEKDILKRELQQAGFLIEKSENFSKVKSPKDAKLDGRETAGVIGLKV